MFTRFDDIKANEITEANYLGFEFTVESAHRFAQLLADNTSLQKLELINCRIEDDVFAELAKGILKRKMPFIHINLDLNYLTAISFPLLKEIIKERKCQHLMFFGNTSLENCEVMLDSHEDEMKDMHDLANSGTSKVYLHYDHPTTRPYKGFLETLRQKSLNELKKPQEETKEKSRVYRNGA